MYSVLDYGRMAGDRVRMDAYSRAIARVVKPGSVVLDLGAGTGIFSLLAARAGARRVHAVDTNPAIALVAALAAENGFANEIVVHHQSSYDLVLDEQVDVVIGDLRGGSPLFGENTGAMRDAHQRLLRPGGVMLPARDRLMIAVSESEPIAQRLAKGWENIERLGFEAGAAKTSILNTVHGDSMDPQHASDMLTGSAEWANIEYASYDGKGLAGDVELATLRPGLARGLAVWFEATIFDDLGYTTAPGNQLAYARLFLPLETPLQLEERARVKLRIRADQRGSRWAWDTEVLDPGGQRRARLRQSSFFGMPTSLENLLRATSKYQPLVSARGARLRAMLAAMDGTRALADLVAIARATSGAGPLPPEEQLLEEARAAVESYGR